MSTVFVLRAFRVKIEIEIPDPQSNLTSIPSLLVSRNDISLTEVARLQNMPPTTFSRNFKRQFGMTFREAKSLYRIERAAQVLLLDKTRSIKEIAALAGYADELTFGRAVKRQKGVCATLFRQLNSPFKT
jgi:AraC-like DNA-binding protein